MARVVRWLKSSQSEVTKLSSLRKQNDVATVEDSSGEFDHEMEDVSIVPLKHTEGKLKHHSMVVQIFTEMPYPLRKSFNSSTPICFEKVLSINLFPILYYGKVLSHIWSRPLYYGFRGISCRLYLLWISCINVALEPNVRVIGRG